MFSFQLLRQHGESHKIKYEYSIPLTIRSGSKESYKWLGGEWSDCSNECAGGMSLSQIFSFVASLDKIRINQITRLLYH